MENTPFANLYKWDQTDTKQETIIQTANNSAKIDQILSGQHERLNGIDETIITVDRRLEDAETLAEKSVVDSTNSLAISLQSDEKATDALDKSDIAKKVAESVQEQFDKVVAEAGSNNPEVVNARGGEVNLNVRLDKVTTQLADTASTLNATQQGENVNLQGGIRLGIRTKSPIITFTSDDGRLEDYTKMKPLFQAKGIPLTMGIIADGAYGNGVRMSIAQIKELLGLGWEVASHTVTHPTLSGLTDQQIENELKNSKMSLESTFGIPIKHVIYPYGAHDIRVRNTARKYYRSGTSTNPGHNAEVHKTYALNRVALGSFFDIATTGYPATNTLEYYKRRVDEAIANNAWLIFMMHTWSPDHDATQQQHISDLIDYIKSKIVPIMNVEDALNRVGNLMDIGDHGSEEYFSVGSTGKTETNLSYRKRASTGLNASSLLSSFEKNMVTATPFTVADNAGFPENAGILETYNLSGADYAFQIFNHYDSDKVYRRRWVVANNNWSSWTIMNPTIIVSATNGYTAASSWSVFPANKIISTKITAAGATGFPNDVAGLLVTNSVTREVGYTRQTYYVFNSGTQYERYAMADGSWSSWESVLKRVGLTFNNFNFGTIPANGQVEQSLTVTGVRVNDTVNASPRTTMENGLIWSSYVSAVDTIVVRVVNVTTVSVSTSLRTWTLNITRS